MHIQCNKMHARDQYQEEIAMQALQSRPKQRYFCSGFLSVYVYVSLFWELPLLKFALTKILTCKLTQEKTIVKRKERSEIVIVLADEKHVFPLMWREDSKFRVFFKQSFSSSLSLGVFPTYSNTNKLTVELTAEGAVLINKHFQDFALE